MAWSLELDLGPDPPGGDRWPLGGRGHSGDRRRLLERSLRRRPRPKACRWSGDPRRATWLSHAACTLAVLPGDFAVASRRSDGLDAVARAWRALCDRLARAHLADLRGAAHQARPLHPSRL